VWVVTPCNVRIFFTLKMEAARSSETLVSTTALHCVTAPEDLDLNLHSREKLKFRKMFLLRVKNL
jgi:hypothetical protein